MNPMLQRLVRTGVSMGAGFVGAKAVEAIWKAATGSSTAPDAEDDNSTLLQIVAFATISAGVSALVEVGSQRLVSKAMSDAGNRGSKQLGSPEVYLQNIFSFYNAGNVRQQLWRCLRLIFK